MKRLLSSSKRAVNNVVKGEIEWEIRPGGMLVQMRDMGDDSSGPMIKIKVSHGSYHHDITVPAQSTFGDLKRVLAEETGLEPKEQRLLFQGKERDDDECLHMVGVRDMSKVVLLQDPASKEKKLVVMKRNPSLLKAFEEVSKVRSEIDKLSDKVTTLDAKVTTLDAKVDEKELIGLTELLMVQLLQLDTIKADGEAKVQRRTEVLRVQGLVDIVENMKAKNSNPISSSCNAESVSSKWEAFECGSGIESLTASAPLPSSTKITQDREVFD